MAMVLRSDRDAENTESRPSQCVVRGSKWTFRVGH